MIESDFGESQMFKMGNLKVVSVRSSSKISSQEKKLSTTNVDVVKSISTSNVTVVKKNTFMSSGSSFVSYFVPL